MSKARSPRESCSITIGIKGLMQTIECSPDDRPSFKTSSRLCTDDPGPAPVGTMTVMEQYPHEWRGYEPIRPSSGWDWRATLRKLLAPIAAVGAFLAKFGAVLLKFKFLLSMLVSAAFYVWLGGWWFGIGLILLLFVHEMGHVVEAKRQGLPVSVPVFIPFMGALITMKQMPHNAWREARLAIAGPLLGSAGALLLYILGLVYDSQQLKALAFLGFLLNLFNLLPVIPLDGGRIAAALHPASGLPASLPCL